MKQARSLADPLVLFDFNGVIADDEPVHEMMLKKVLAEEGITITSDDYHDIYLGYDDRGCFIEAFRRNGRPLNEAGIADLTARKSKYYDAYIEEHLVLFPGAVECVRIMKKAFPVGVVSGALRHEIEVILKLAGIPDAFPLVVAAEDTEQCKPHPEGYLKALARHNEMLAADGVRIGAEWCVVIEDSLAGVQSAKRAGMRCVAVTHSYEADELSEADRVIEHLEAFTPDLVRELAG